MDIFMDKLTNTLSAEEMIKANGTAETEELERLKGETAEYKECLDKLEKLLADSSDRLEAGVARLENAQMDTSGIERLIETGVSRIENARTDTSEIERLVETGVARLENAQVDTSSIERLVEEGVGRLRESQIDTSGIERLVEESIEKLQQSSDDIERLTDISLAKLGQIGRNEELLDQVRAIETKISELTNMQDENLADLGSILEKKILQVPYLVEERIGQKDSVGDQLEEKFASSKEQTDAKFLEMSESVHRECVKVYRNVQAVVVEENAKQLEQLTSTVSQLQGSIDRVFKVAMGGLVLSAATLVFQILSYMHIL